MAQLTGTHEFDGMQVGFVKVKTIGNHQLGLIALRRANHFLALRLVGSHGFFAQHMNASVGGLHGIVAMHAVGQRDIDGVNFAAVHEMRIVLIGVDRFHAVFFAELLGFGGIVGGGVLSGSAACITVVVFCAAAATVKTRTTIRVFIPVMLGCKAGCDKVTLVCGNQEM